MSDAKFLISGDNLKLPSSCTLYVTPSGTSNNHTHCDVWLWHGFLEKWVKLFGMCSGSICKHVPLVLQWKLPVLSLRLTIWSNKYYKRAHSRRCHKGGGLFMFSISFSPSHASISNCKESWFEHMDLKIWSWMGDMERERLRLLGPYNGDPGDMEKYRFHLFHERSVDVWKT